MDGPNEKEVSTVITAEADPVTLIVSEETPLSKTDDGPAREDMSKSAAPSSDAATYLYAEDLGKGMLGHSRKATRRGLNRPVVVKQITGERLRNTAAAKRLKEDAAVMTNLTHPQIAAVYSCEFNGTTNATIVSDYVEGATLEEIFLSQGFLDADYCVDIFKQIAEGLFGLHHVGVVHRNLKPSNIVVQTTAHGGFSVKLLDGGLARFIQADADEDGNGGALLSDPSYTSPEQCLGRDIDAQSDVYVFGLLLYEALTGRKPFDGGTKMQVVLKQINRRPKKLSAVAPDLALPKSLESLVSKCLEKNKENRPRSFDEIAAILDAIDDEMNRSAAAVPETKSTQEVSKTDSLKESLKKRSRASLFFSIATLTILIFGVSSVARVNHRHRYHSGHDIVYSAGHIYHLKKMSAASLVDLGERVLQQGQLIEAVNVFNKAIQKLEETGASSLETAAVYGRVGEVYATLQQQREGRPGVMSAPVNDVSLNSAYLSPEKLVGSPVSQFTSYQIARLSERSATNPTALGGDSFNRLAERNLETAIAKYRAARMLSIQQKGLVELLANVKFHMAKLEESEMLRKDLLKIARTAPVVDKNYLALQFANLGATQLAAGRATDSVESLKKALSIDDAAHGRTATGPNTGLIELNLANALQRTDKLPEAEQLLKKLYATANSASIQDTALRIRSGEMLSDTLHKMNDIAAASAVELRLLKDLRMFNATTEKLTRTTGR
ncbi:MAG: serine/threonine-protein kinase [Candidatus Obscuribacterales bacterium]|nr:serine/threonine-protein kinase [Candidatus Obscuribacterales bacterium]